MWLFLPFHFLNWIVTEVLKLFPGEEFLNLPAAVNEAVGYLGGMALWFVSLMGADFTAAFMSALAFVVGFEVGIIVVRTLLRMLALGLGVRFAAAFIKDVKPNMSMS